MPGACRVITSNRPKAVKLAEAVVALAGPALKRLPPTRPPAVITIDQKEMRFVPETVAIRAGDRVRFTNSDAQTHNIFARTIRGCGSATPLPTVRKRPSFPGPVESAVPSRCVQVPQPDARLDLRFRPSLFPDHGRQRPVSPGKRAAGGIPAGGRTSGRRAFRCPGHPCQTARNPEDGNRTHSPRQIGGLAPNLESNRMQTPSLPNGISNPPRIVFQSVRLDGRLAVVAIRAAGPVFSGGGRRRRARPFFEFSARHAQNARLGDARQLAHAAGPGLRRPPLQRAVARCLRNTGSRSPVWSKSRVTLTLEEIRKRPAAERAR